MLVASPGGRIDATTLSAVNSQAAALLVNQPGTLALILTAPHGGSEPVPGVAPRQTGTTSQDSRTIELANAISDGVEARLCGTPYLVEALFQRRYIDANRAASEAYESPPAASYYAAYHAAIRADVDEVRAAYSGIGLLVDVHGQSDDPGRIHRGTQNGLTVAALLKRGGLDALVGPASVFGSLQAEGYDVFPPNTPLRQPPEDSRFNGGYTVETYGSHRPDGIDAIQIETGSNLRQASTLPLYADQLADALAGFVRAYLDSTDRCVTAPAAGATG